MEHSKKLNILVVHNYYKQHGGEDYICEKEVNLLKNKGHNVITYYRFNDEIDNSLIKKILFPAQLLFSFKTYFDIKRIIINNGIDIIHVHNYMFCVSQSVYYAAKSLKVPIVQSIHNYRFVCPNALLYHGNSICEKCIYDNIFQSIKYKCYKKSYVITALLAISIVIHRITKIHNYVNFICNTNFVISKILYDKTILKDKVYIKKNFTEQKKNIGIVNSRENAFVYAARLDENKGIKFLLESWKMYNDPRYKLYICGTGELQDWCNEYITCNNLKNVEMLGYVKHDVMIELFSKCKALIYPSRWYEAMPMAIIDAFSVGTPVIGPNFGNVGEMIIDGVNGYKYESNCMNSFMKAIEYVCNRNDFYENIKKYYFENYSPEINYNNLIKIYNKILNNNVESLYK